MTTPRLWLGLALLCLVATAFADDDFIVYSPHVTQGQSEVELRGYRFQDGRGEFDRSGGYEMALAHTFTSWWKTELYVGEFAYAPGTGRQLAGYEFENTFQIGSPGEFPVDLGFLLSYVRRKDPLQADSLEMGPLLEKQIGRIIQRLNLIWEKPIGGNAGGQYAFRSAYSAGYKVSAAFVPGIEAYYRPADDAHQVGPAFSGEWHWGEHGEELEYSMAWLMGVNAGAPQRTLVLRVAYEFF